MRSELFKGTTPCNSCPYRKDTPRAHWSKKEFELLLLKESDAFGAIYKCHKNNGTVCKGWLINQDKRNLPSIALRLGLTCNNVTRKYLDKLHCKTPMFETVQEMCGANFPELLK